MRRYARLDPPDGRARRGEEGRRSRRPLLSMTLEILWFCLLAFSGRAISCSRGSTSASACCSRSSAGARRTASTMLETIGPFWDGNEVWLVDRRRRDVRRLPGLVRDDVLGLLPRPAARARAPDRPRDLVRVAREGGEPALAGVLDLDEHDRRRSARRCSGASRSRACCTASRSPPSRTSPATSGTCSASTPSLAGIAVVLLFALHGAVFLTLRTLGDLHERARRTAARLAPVAAVVGAGFLVWTLVVADDVNDKGVFPGVVLVASPRSPPSPRSCSCGRATRARVRGHGD